MARMFRVDRVGRAGREMGEAKRKRQPWELKAATGSIKQRNGTSGFLVVGYGESSGTGHPVVTSSVRAASGPRTVGGDSLISGT